MSEHCSISNRLKKTFLPFSDQQLHQSRIWCSFWLLKSRLLVHFPDLPKPVLKLIQGWTDVFENEIIEFFCEVDSEIYNFTWYRNNEQLQEDTVLTLYPDDPYLNITSVEQVHQGGYTCQVYSEKRSSLEFSNTVNITVYGEHYLKIMFIKELSLLDFICVFSIPDRFLATFTASHI